MSETPFHHALRLAWSDGRLSRDGAKALEEIQQMLILNDKERAEVEIDFIDNVIPSMKKIGFGEGDKKLRQWIDELNTIEPHDKQSSVQAIAQLSVQRGLTRQGWLTGMQHCAQLGMEMDFAKAVWETNDKTSAEWKTTLQPLADALGIND